MSKNLSSIGSTRELAKTLQEIGLRDKGKGLKGALFNVSDEANSQLTEEERLQGFKKKALYWSLVFVLVVMLLFGMKWYKKRLVTVREEIGRIVVMKGIPKDNPIMETFKRMYHIRWLPTLEMMLSELRRMPINFDRFPDNTEPGSYLEHIKRHNKPFDAKDAMAWRTRLIRKPYQ